ncbi:hypothetical protein [Kitasatospora sp. NPDC002040]|uniref:anti-sigma factor family protein n=1 Tax=Kitasatospora sp. NPDC002040 TaxID=3154661 RepID=UPI00331B9888
MTPSWPETGHPDIDLLADLAEDLADPAGLPLLQAHLADCAECTDTFTALAEVRELLGSAGDELPPLPADVADRIDAALAAEAAAPVTPAAAPTTPVPLTRRQDGRTHRARRRARALLAAAACLAVLGLGGTLLAQQHGATGVADTAAAGKAAQASPAGTGETAPGGTGTVFTEAALAGQIQQVVQRSPATASGQSSPTAPPSKEPPLLGPGTGSEENSAPPRSSPCPAVGTGTPVATAPGSFGPDRVTALVFPLGQDRLDVYLVTADCRVLLHRTVPNG